MSKRKKTKKKYDYFKIDQNSIMNLKNICPRNEFRKVNPNVLKTLNFLPSDLVSKYDSVLIVSSGSSESEIYYMMNGNRVDIKDKAIDQMPFGIICSGSDALTSGSLIQHGDWSGRTHKPSDQFWNYLSSSGIGNLYPITELPLQNSGSIKDLKIQSQNSAFSDLIKHLKEMLFDIDN
jgi:hypothetical protein